MIIEINYDWVLINGVKVERPARISRSVWLTWWENTKYLNGKKVIRGVLTNDARMV